LTIHRAYPGDSSDIQLSIPHLNAPNDIAVDLPRGRLYWADTGSEKVCRSDLEGAHVQDILVPDLSFQRIVQIEIDLTEQNIYGVTQLGSQCSIIKIDADLVDGTLADAILIIDLPDWCDTLALDELGRKLYWVSGGSGQEQVMHRANLDGSGLEVFRPLGEIGRVPLSVDTRGRRIYWANSTENRIYSTNLDNTDTRSFSVPDVYFKDLFVDTDRGLVYWTQGTKVQRSTFNGENIQDMIDTGSVDNAPRSVLVTGASTVAVPALSRAGLELMVLVLSLAAIVFMRRTKLHP